MCIIVRPEVLLANILDSKDEFDGIDFSQIISYCDRVTNVVNAMSKNIYFESYNESLCNVISNYSSVFRVFNGRFYRKNCINLSYFNSSYPSEISEIFIKVAKEVQ